MAIVRVNKSLITGLSTDAKPTLSYYSEGARFYESDTQLSYIWSRGQWIAQGTTSSTTTPSTPSTPTTPGTSTNVYNSDGTIPVNTARKIYLADDTAFLDVVGDNVIRARFGANNINLTAPTVSIIGTNNVQLSIGTTPPEAGQALIAKDAAGNLEWGDVEAEGDFVDLTTDQSIDGAKTFLKPLERFIGAPGILYSNDFEVDLGDFVIEPDSTMANDWTIIEGTATADGQGNDTQDDTVARMSITKTTTQETLIVFTALVSTEEEYDFLNIYVNGFKKFSADGILPITEYSVPVTDIGNVKIVFEYSKDSSASDGTDSVQILDFIWYDSTQIVDIVRLNSSLLKADAAQSNTWTLPSDSGVLALEKNIIIPETLYTGNGTIENSRTVYSKAGEYLKFRHQGTSDSLELTPGELKLIYPQISINNKAGGTMSFGTSGILLYASNGMRFRISETPGSFDPAVVGTILTVTDTTGKVDFLPPATGNTPTGLEALDEGNGIGWRLIGQDPADHVDIGQNAVDFTIPSSSGNYGAPHPYDFAVGLPMQHNNSPNFKTGKNTYLNASSTINWTTNGRMGFSVIFGNSHTINTNSGSSNYNFYGGSNHLIIHGITATEQGYNFLMGSDHDMRGKVGHTTILGDSNSIEDTNEFVKAGFIVGMDNVLTPFSGWSSLQGFSMIGTGLIGKRHGEHVIGQWNTSYTPTGATTDRLFTLGNGTGVVIRSDALIVRFDGSVEAPSITNTLIDSIGAKSLISKEYADANYGGGGGISEAPQDGTPYSRQDAGWVSSPTGSTPTGLEAINEGNGTAWRLVGKSPANVGNAGYHSIDMGEYYSTSSTAGAIADHAFIGNGDSNAVRGNAYGGYTLGGGANLIEGSAVGAGALGNFNTINEGYGALAAGAYNTINPVVQGAGILALGHGNDVTGDVPIGAIGLALSVNARNQLAVGVSNTIYGGGTTASNRPIFTVGNGTHNTPDGKWTAVLRSDALVVQFDGLVRAPSVTNTLIANDSTGKALVSKEYQAEYAVTNDTDAYGTSAKVQNIVTLNQTEYDAIPTKDDNTLYIIT